MVYFWEPQYAPFKLFIATYVLLGYAATYENGEISGVYLQQVVCRLCCIELHKLHFVVSVDSPVVVTFETV